MDNRVYRLDLEISEVEILGALEAVEVEVILSVESLGETLLVEARVEDMVQGVKVLVEFV